jgi:hypothetical protein
MVAPFHGEEIGDGGDVGQFLNLRQKIQSGRRTRYFAELLGKKIGPFRCLSPIQAISPVFPKEYAVRDEPSGLD